MGNLTGAGGGGGGDGGGGLGGEANGWCGEEGAGVDGSVTMALAVKSLPDNVIATSTAVRPVWAPNDTAFGAKR